MATVTLTYENSPTRTLAVSVDEGDGSKVPVYGRDLRNSPRVALSSGTAPAAVGGANECYHAILTVAGGADTDIDLQAFVDVALRTGRSMARAKTIEFWLLGTADTALGGNACSGVTITPGAVNGCLMFLADASDGIVLGNGDRVEWTTRRAAGNVVDATHKVINVLNDDAVVSAKVLIIINGGAT